MSDIPGINVSNLQHGEVPRFVDMIIKSGDCSDMMSVFNEIAPTGSDELGVYVAVLQELGTRICTLLSDDKQLENVHLQWTNDESDAETITIGTTVRAGPVARRLLSAFPPSPSPNIQLIPRPTTSQNVPGSSGTIVCSGAGGGRAKESRVQFNVNNRR